MDSRGVMRLCGLLLLTAGCQHQTMSVPSPGPMSPSARPPQAIDPASIKKALAKPKELPPQVLVKYADFKAGEAFNPKSKPAAQQQLREQASQDYERAIKSNPKYVPAYQGLARLCVAMGDGERAVEIYQKALRIDAKNAALWYELGMYYNAQKDWSAALDSLNRTVKIDPSNRTYVNAIGVVLAEAGRYDESLNCFVRSSGEAMGSYRLAQTLDRLQQPGLSRYYLEAALRKNPNLAATMNPPVQQTAYESEADPIANAPAPSLLPASVAAPPSDQPSPPQQQQLFLPPPPSG